uniref:Uncharacterized protein n=1 Tax=Helianthus annuus TaxID=4232 RepID=A0A251RZI1_HELAN
MLILDNIRSGPQTSKKATMLANPRSGGPGVNGGKMSNMEMTSQLGRVGRSKSCHYFSRVGQTHYLYIIKEWRS